jgi:putative membrane protein
MLWIKSFHIISVICWFAVLFYLPRLFVYHAMSKDEISKERFKVMERKLIRGIGNPAMISTFIFGIWLVTYIYLWKQFCEDNNTRSHVFYRWFNEFPVVLLIAIICLVVVKPTW